jgi:hypothetical protein
LEELLRDVVEDPSLNTRERLLARAKVAGWTTST